MPFFAQAGDGFNTDLYPGSGTDADLHSRPGRPRLRAVIETRRAESWRVDGRDIVDDDVATVIAGLREVVIADPWYKAWPVATHGSLAWDDGVWLIAGRAASPTGNTTDHWCLLTKLGAILVIVFGEPDVDGLRSIAYPQETTVHPL